MNSKYKGFTLIEMLIVMGILSVLMAIGVSVARFAIQRANNIQHQSAVDQLYQAFQSYYTDNREYPYYSDQEGGGSGRTGLERSFGDALDGGVLSRYVDAAFDGGSPATFYYMTRDQFQTSPQEFLVCVAYGGLDDDAGLGGYCNGNGFGVLGCVAGSPIDKKVMDEAEFEANVRDCASTDGWASDWVPASGGWE